MQRYMDCLDRGCRYISCLFCRYFRLGCVLYNQAMHINVGLLKQVLNAANQIQIMQKIIISLINLTIFLFHLRRVVKLSVDIPSIASILRQ